MGNNVLLVEDEDALRLFVGDSLRNEGHTVEYASDGDEAFHKATSLPIDLIILDVMLPGIDGFEVLKKIRARSAVPVLMLTARGDETDRIVGLEVGADDYLPKTFSTRELLARLRAVLRRSAATAASNQAADAPPTELVVGGLRVNLDARSAVMDATPLVLTPVEFDLLSSLAKARGRVKTRESLLDECRDRNYDVFDRSIDVHISSLRKKLGDDAKEPRYIRTVRSAGYMMVGPE